jgi:hypothetical protein
LEALIPIFASSIADFQVIVPNQLFAEHCVL